MSDPSPQQVAEQQFPVAAIVCISIGAYIVVVAVILLVRQILLGKGFCTGACSCCGEEGKLQCCECCIACSEAMNCCKAPSVESCLDSICPARRNYDCADIVMCQCCADPDNQCCSCCGGDTPLCDCGNCNCMCDCKPPDCDTINCFCCELAVKQPLQDDDSLDGQIPPQAPATQPGRMAQAGMTSTGGYNPQR